MDGRAHDDARRSASVSSGVTPGQGHALYASGLTARPDFEAVLSPALDVALAHPRVAGDGAAVLGVSHGGYLAARAAAFEPRVRALVLDPGVMRVVDATLGQLPDELVARFRAGDREGFERELESAQAGSADVRFVVVKAREPWGLGTALYDALSGLAGMDLADVAARVACPALVLDPDDAEAWPGQSREVADALGGPVTLERFSADDGAGLDCEILAPQVRNQRVFDWLRGPPEERIVSDDPQAGIGWCRALVFEAEDLGRATAFWQALLGVEVIDRREDWVQLGRDRGGIYLGFLPARGERPNAIRARPDIQVADLDAAVRLIEELGGRLLSIDEDPEGEHRVMADTEGNEFTILGPLPRDEAERIGLA